MVFRFRTYSDRNLATFRTKIPLLELMTLWYARLGSFFSNFGQISHLGKIKPNILLHAPW